jgi:hypothetical protein
MDTIVRTDTITFSAVGLAGSPARATATGTPLAAAKLAAQFPATSLAGIAVTPPPTVEVQDMFGNHVTNATNLVTLTPNDAPPNGVLGGNAVQAINGVATFSNLVPNVPGNYSMDVTAIGLAPTTADLLATGVSVSPDFLSLSPGVQQQLIPTFVGIPPGAVVWASGAPAVASVSATGLVTGISQGTATIRVTLLSDTRVKFDVTVTVAPAGAATVAIQGITDNATGFPVFLSNVSGIIDVQLSVVTNGNNISHTSLYLDAVEVAQQVGGAGVVTLSLNTAATLTGGQLRFCNGPRQLQGRVFYPGSPLGGVASNTIVLTFNNPGSC